MVVMAAVFIALSSSLAFANLQNIGIIVPDSTLKNYNASVIAKGAGFVQFIKGSPSNPPTAVANDSTQALSGTDAYAIFKDPNNATLLNQAVKGKVGDFTGYGAGNGGFAVKNQFDHSISTNYYVRYWTTDGYYGNSAPQSFWSSGDPVPVDLTFSSFTLYKADKPYSPDITLIKQVESTNKDLYPEGTEAKVSQLSFTWKDGTTGANGNIQVKGDGTLKSYMLQINKGDATFSQNPPYKIQLDETSYTLDKTNDPDKTFFSDTNATYYARVVAVNYFGNTPSPAIPFKVAVIGEGGGVAGESMVLNLVKTADLGVNQFEFTLDPTKTIFYTKQGETLTSTELTAKTVKGLVDAINTFAGGAAVKSVGWWNKDVNSSQRMEGYTISSGVWTGSVGTAGNGTETLENKVYQVSVSPSIVNFKMTREVGK